MPSFVFDYITPDGPKRELFTLDNDQPIGIQVHRVLAELRQQGIVLLGGRDDELSIEWNGMRLDERLAPEALRITATRPLELRMRPRLSSQVEVRPADRAAAPRSLFLPIGVVSAALGGALGGACAWTLLAASRVAAESNQDRDALAALTLVGCAGLFFVLAQHGRTRRVWLGLLGLAVGAPLTAALSVGATSALVSAGTSFVTQRLVLCAVVGTLGTLTLALSARRPGPFLALAESLGLGAAAGVCCGLLASLESLGVGEALSFPLFGAGLATAAAWPPLRRAYAVCELLPARRHLLAALSMKSFPLPYTGMLLLEQGARVQRQGDNVLWDAPVPLRVEESSVAGTAMVVNGDRVKVGRRVYHFRELP